MLFFSVVTHAAPGVNQTISFQGRLLSSAGTPVPDGFYNVQFKIYQDGTGAAAGNPGGTLKWTETYVNNGGTNGVKVSNGYMSVNLGAQTPFGTNVDWNQDTLWLSMNVAGLASNCTTFNSGNCTADGEMAPMKRLTATPYSLNSAKLEGRGADGFIQNGTAQQTANFSIAGTGRATILQGTAGVESAFFDRGDAGLLSIGAQQATSIQIGSATADQSISIGTGAGVTNLALGNTNGSSSLDLQGGTSGVAVTTSGGFKVHTESTDRDTLVIGDNGSATINLSNETGFVINSTGNQSVLQVGNDGAIQTGSGSVLAVNGSARFNQGIQVGDGNATNEAKLLTLDQASAAPAGTGDALLGSMYYDTTLGKVQCYEADGWGACSASPDSFVSLSPEYSNAVQNGNGIGSLTSDICSDTLNINDGSASQPAICGTNETYNFYDWTSTQSTSQTKNLFVTYQLPGTFKEFVSGGTSLLGRTDSADSTLSYQLYRNTPTGLVACGSVMEVSTGVQSSWQKKVADSTNDPSNCAFEAGESIVFKVSFAASDNAHAYASTLNFAFRNE
jgi:hypothetical protein